MRHSNTGIFIASLAAGPLFLLWSALAAIYRTVPKPVPLDFGPGEVAAALFLLFPAAVLGLFLSILPNFLGTLALTRLGEICRPARARVLWTGTGALIGCAGAACMGWLAEPFATAGFALIATAATCASICRRRAAWD